MALVFPSSTPSYYYFSPTVTTNPTNPNSQMYKIVNSPPPQYVPVQSYPNPTYIGTDGISISPSIYYHNTNNMIPIKRLFNDENGGQLEGDSLNNFQQSYHTLNNQQLLPIHSNSITPNIIGIYNNNNGSPTFDSNISSSSSIDSSISNNEIFNYKKRPISEVESSPENDQTENEKDSDDGEDFDDYPDEEDFQQELRLALSPFVNSIFKSKSTLQLLPIISECTKDDIGFGDLLSKMKLLYDQNSPIENIYAQFLQLLVRIDGDIRMVKYLQENGVTNEDLEFVNTIPLTQISPISSSKKKRERMRKSSSRGIRSPPNKWTKDESQTLIKLVSENGDKQWKKIAAKLGGHKTGAQCAQHWKRVLSPEIKKGSWDEAEEELLFLLVDKHGQSWKNVAIEIKTRTDIQCRYQYFKAITSRKTHWSQNEDEILLKKVKSMTLMDEKVSFQAVAKHLAKAKATKIPRTSLECKIRWGQLQTQSQQQQSNLSSLHSQQYNEKFLIRQHLQQQLHQQQIDSSNSSNFLNPMNTNTNNNSFNDYSQII